MSEAIRKHLKKLGSILPSLRKQKDDESLSSEPSKPELVDVHYGCDSCSQGIKEGETRYNCGECEVSYDICASCYEKGVGDTHKEALGHLHDLSPEVRANFMTTRHVKSDTLEETLLNMFHYYAERQAIGVYVESKDRYEYLKFREVEELVTSLSSALNHVMSHDHERMVALCSVVSLEWYVADYACAIMGIPTVGITASCDEETISYILSQTSASVALCSPDLYPVFLSIAEEQCPSLKEIIVTDFKESDQKQCDNLTKPVRSDLKVWLFSDLISKGAVEPIDLTQFKTDPDDIFTIAYTSGSTGKPKGCVFSRKLWLNHIHVPTSFMMGVKRVWFSFQPPSHMLERESFHLTLLSGCKCGIYRGSMEHLFDDMCKVRPTVITSTPRIYAMIYNEYLQELYQEYQTYIKERVISNGIEQVPTTSLTGSEENNTNTGQENQVPKTGLKEEDTSKEVTKKETIVAPPPLSSPPPDFDPFNIPYEVRDKVKERFKGYFGGREKVLAVGGAAVPAELKTFLSFCFDGLVQEGYGTTEAGGITTGEWSMGDVTIRLRDVPEMGYFTSDKPPRGEVCVKTSYMISGYYKNQEETDEKFQNGFFCTGDIGAMERPGFVRVIDRKKNIFKLAQGEFVAPEKIEGVFESRSNLIEQVYLYGNIYQNNVVAVIIPHMEALKQWKKSNNDEDNESDASDDVHDIEQLCNLPEVNDLYMNELRALGQAQGLQGWEIPASIIIDPQPFSVENHLLTCTMKKSRPQLEKRYKMKLEALYDAMARAKGITKLSVENQIFNSFLSELNSRGIIKQNGYPQPSLPLDMSLSLTQMGGDSLSAMHLSNLLKQQLSVELSAHVILKQPLCNIFQHIVSALSGEVDDIILHNQIDHVTHSHVNWEEEIDISFLRGVASPDDTTTVESERERVVLLTGGTGFLGRFILWELLNSKRVSLVYCLGRSGKDFSAQDRVLKLLGTLSKEIFDKEESEKVLRTILQKLVTFESDLSKPRLGLNEEDYTLVKRTTDLVIHNGANVNHVLLYNDLKETNVNSTKEILKLCRDEKQKSLHYVSSLGVYSLLPWETANEKTLPNKDRLPKLSGYSQSKWVSEQLVIEAVNHKLITSASIYRPGLVGAHSKTGHANLRDWFYALVYSVNHLRHYPTGMIWDDGYTDITPVDIVAQGIVELSLMNNNGNIYPTNSTAGIYHMIGSGMQGMANVISSLNGTGLDTIQPLDENAFLKLLAEEASKSVDSTIVSLHLLLSHGAHPLSPGRAVISSELTQTILNPTGIYLDAPVDKYMDIYVQYLKNNQLFK